MTLILLSTQNLAMRRPQSRGTAHLAAGVRALPNGGVFKSAAVEVLHREKRLMTTGEISKLALEWGLLKCSGKTPEATMASSLYSDIKRHNTAAVFIRPQEGMFGLREWIQQGLMPPEAGVLSAGATASTRRKRPAAAAAAAAAAADINHQAEVGLYNSFHSPVYNNLKDFITLVLQAPNKKYKGRQLSPPPSTDVVHAAVAAGQTTSMRQHGDNHIAPEIADKDWAAATPVQAQGASFQPRRRLTSDSGIPAIETSNTPPQPHHFTLMGYSERSQINQIDAGFGATLIELEWKVVAVEEKWGSLHPLAGRAHLLMYHACVQHTRNDFAVMLRAQIALTR